MSEFKLTQNYQSNKAEDHLLEDHLLGDPLM